MEKIVIKNPEEQDIIGVMDLPKGKEPFPTIIIAHGFKGFKDQIHFVNLSKQLNQAGFLTFRFDFTNGVGESDGDIFDITIEHYVNDLRAVYEYISTNDLIDKENIIIYATSLGATTSLLFAAQNPRIKLLILHEPVTEMKKLHATEVDCDKWKKQGYWIFHSETKNRDYKVGYQYYEERQKYNMFEVAEKIEIPTLIIHNPEAKELPYADSKEILKKLPKGSKIQSLPGIPHTPMKEEDIRRIGEAMISFI